MHHLSFLLVLVLWFHLNFATGFVFPVPVTLNERLCRFGRLHPFTKIMEIRSKNVPSETEIRTIHHKSPLMELNESSPLQSTTKERTALIILNAPMQSPMSPLFQLLWNSSNFHVCADGGANRLLNVCRTFHQNSKADGGEAVYIPDCITGDLDSLLPDTQRFYQEKGVKILPVADQDTNDLDKAIAAVMEHFLTFPTCTETIRCVVYGAFGGRFDQEMASFQSLYRYNATSLQLFLYDDHTMAFLLPCNCVNVIHLLPNSSAVGNVGEGPTCGLIPLGCGVDSVTTRGLQWNLHEQPSSFGGLVSTSNRIVSSEVEVICSHPLVFTAQVHAGVTTVWSENET